MKLDRNIEKNKGRGKYALINLRTNKIEFGNKGDDDEFFVIKLKDQFANFALAGYRRGLESHHYEDKETEKEMMEFSRELLEMEQRSGPNNPNCKLPD